jgi:hypothetical protein
VRPDILGGVNRLPAISEFSSGYTFLLLARAKFVHFSAEVASMSFPEWRKELHDEALIGISGKVQCQ